MEKFWTVYVFRFVSIFFLTAIFISSLFYQGGSLFDPEQIGYSFSNNFLSELGGYKSRSGEVNFLSSFFFNTSMFLFALAGIGFLYVPNLFRDVKKNYLLSWIGSIFFFIACFLFSGVGLTPHDLYKDIHSFFAINAFRFLIPASILYVIVFFRSNVHNKYTLITIIYLISTFAYVLYQIFREEPLKSPEALVESVTIQKIIAIISIISIFSLSFGFSSKLMSKKR